MSIGDALGWMGYAVLGSAIIWLLLLLRTKVAEQAEAQRIADATFEAQALRAIRTVESSMMPPGIQTEAQPLMSSALVDEMPIPAAAFPVHESRYSESQAEDYYRQSADISCAAVLTQLRNSGLVDQVEGFLELNGNPKGAVVLRMKGGKHALLVPYFESEPFALRNLRRYHMIVYVGRNGKAVVLKSLEEVIAANVSASMGGF
ncbi:MAG: hypothetical protein ACR2IE_11490 [Candidatus Sumerlaeaceae bacterium]